MNNWKRRSCLSVWILWVLEIFLLCFVIAYICFNAEDKYKSTIQNLAVAVSEKLTEEDCIKVCDTKECVHHSKILIDDVQENVEPCEDFYKFACGGYLEKMNPDKSSSFMTQYLSITRNKMKNLLDNIEASPESPIGKTKTVYDSCLKYDSSEKHALPDLLQIINDFGIRDWPHLAPDYKFVEPNVVGVISNLLIYKEYGFVSFLAGSMRPNEQIHKINLTLNIQDSPYGKNDPELRKYKVTRILKYFNLDTEAINEIWKDSEAIFNVTESLKVESEIMSEDDEDSYMDWMECKGEDKDKWEKLCETLDSFINNLGMSERVNKNYAKIPSIYRYYVKNVFRALENFSDRSVANYLVLNVFLEHLKDLNLYFRLLTEEPPKFDVFNDFGPNNHWEQCINWIIGHTPSALVYEHLKDDVTLTVLQEVENLTNEMILETKEEVSHQKWIPDHVLEDLIEQVENIQHVSYDFIIQVISNEAFLSRFFEKFMPSERSFIMNVFEYRRFTKVQEISGFSIFELNQFIGKMFIPGAGGGDGEITISPGLLLPPTYTHRLERLINVATLGSIIVHEIGHNVQSFLYKMSGFNLSESDYYNGNSQCLSKQFSEFRIESLGQNLDGSNHLNENEADNIAISVIDKVIKKYVANGVEISMPGLPYTTKQLLYISFAQNWCTSVTVQREKLALKSDNHSPSNFRTIGMMQNSKGFSEAFGCPEGSYMNPSVKCFFLNEHEDD